MTTENTPAPSGEYAPNTTGSFRARVRHDAQRECRSTYSDAELLIDDLTACERALEAARAERDQYRDQADGLRLTLDIVRAERDSVRVLGNETYHCLKACEADRDAARAALLHLTQRNHVHSDGCSACVATFAALRSAQEAGRG